MIELFQDIFRNISLGNEIVFELPTHSYVRLWKLCHFKRDIRAFPLYTIALNNNIGWCIFLIKFSKKDNRAKF